MRARLPIVPGAKFGRWTVLFKSTNYGGFQRARCRCACGAERDIKVASLFAGRSHSCGCESIEKLRAARLTHGHTVNYTPSPEFRCWSGMIERTTNPKNKHFKDYGARGIRVCERWKSFECFLADMGLRPSPRHSIERTNNNQGYSPDNCVWAVPSVQARNTRRNLMVPYEGDLVPLVVAVEKLGYPPGGAFYKRVRDRIRVEGWPAEKALHTPIRHQAAKAGGRR